MTAARAPGGVFGPDAAPGGFVLPFQVEPFGPRGRFVALGAAADAIVSVHAHPEPVARLLAQTLALAPCLAGALKYDGVFTLQVSGSGPLRTLMADVTSDGALRGYAACDAAGVERMAAEHGPDIPLPRLAGGGHIAFTVDRRDREDRYQGIVELSGPTLAECVHAYFRDSEQLETGIALAAARAPVDGWRAAAMMVQRLPFDGGAGAPAGVGEEEYDEGWRGAIVLMSGCGPEELLAASAAPEALLYRLFHETGVRAWPARPLEARCRCSPERVARVLRSLSAAELRDMMVDGEIVVMCEFCKTERRYDGPALAALRRAGGDDAAADGAPGPGG